MKYPALRDEIQSMVSSMPNVATVSIDLDGASIYGSFGLLDGESLVFSILPVEGQQYHEVSMVRSKDTPEMATVAVELCRLAQEQLSEDEGLQTRISGEPGSVES